MNVARTAARSFARTSITFAVRPFSVSRRAMIFGGTGNPSPEQLQAMERLRETVLANPKLMDSLRELQEKIVNKGAFTPGKQPLMMQMMSLMTDKDIRSSLIKFKETLDETGVKFNKDDMAVLGEFFMKK